MNSLPSHPFNETVTDQKMTYDAIIIGGGAAGLHCAATLGHTGAKTLIIDHANKVGKKILMSGGGRCNFTNYEIYPQNYISTNPHFCKSALSRYTQHHFLELIYKYEIPFHEKTKGQLFCDNKAKDILNMLLNECDEAGVEIFTSTKVDAIQLKATEDTPYYQLTTSTGIFQTSALVIATGGLSIPTMGATGFGYEIAQQFGLKVTAKHAALVPFTFDQPYLELARILAGLSIEASFTVNNMTFTDQMLFTHKGISGPAVLQISNYWWPRQEIVINLLPEIELNSKLEEEKINKNKKTIQNLISEFRPKRFVHAWFAQQSTITHLAERTPSQLNAKDIYNIAEAFHQWHHTPKGTEGYKTAEVTRGGVNTDEISSKTFEAKKQKGLYFIGEVLDVTGWLGGYNFQWAWASGWCAAQAIHTRRTNQTC